MSASFLRFRPISAAATLALCAGQAHAAGFALIEQSVSDMGTAYAGGGALASDPSTLFFNPAGMTRLEGTQASAGLHAVRTTAKFSDGGSTFAPALGGAPLGGGNGGDAGGLHAVPHTYFTHAMDDGKLWLGFAINAPFGLTTEYDSDWVGRYHAIESSIMTLNFNPSIAYKVSEKLSLSAGVSAQYLKAKLSNAVDYGSIDALPVALGGFGGGLGTMGPGSADGMAELDGDSWGFGANFGVLIEPSDNTRIGLHFRSEIEHDVEGDADFYGGAQPLASAATGGALFTDTTFGADVTLPATAAISFFHQVNKELALMADYTWTGWSSIPELRIEFDNAQPDNVTTLDFRDTYRIGVGAQYSPMDSDATYRMGVAFDQSPVHDPTHRSARLPDEDRIWLSLGARFKLGKDMWMDIGYAHLFMDDPEISKTATPGSEDFLRGSLVGSYDASVDILSAQAEIRFD